MKIRTLEKLQQVTTRAGIIKFDDNGLSTGTWSGDAKIAEDVPEILREFFDANPAFEVITDAKGKKAVAPVISEEDAEPEEEWEEDETTHVKKKKKKLLNNHNSYS